MKEVLSKVSPRTTHERREAMAITPLQTISRFY